MHENTGNIETRRTRRIGFLKKAIIIFAGAVVAASAIGPINKALAQTPEIPSAGAAGVANSIGSITNALAQTVETPPNPENHEGSFPTIMSVAGESSDPSQPVTNITSIKIGKAYIESNHDFPIVSTKMYFAARTSEEANDSSLKGREKKYFSDWNNENQEVAKQMFLDEISKNYANATGSEFWLNYVGHGSLDNKNRWHTSVFKSKDGYSVSVKPSDFSVAIARGIKIRSDAGKDLIPFQFNILSCHSGGIVGPAANTADQIKEEQALNAIQYEISSALDLFNIEKSARPKITVFTSVTPQALSSGIPDKNMFDFIYDKMKNGESLEKAALEWDENGKLFIYGREVYQGGSDTTSDQISKNPNVSGIHDVVHTTAWHVSNALTTDNPDGTRRIVLTVENIGSQNSEVTVSQTSDSSHPDSIPDATTTELEPFIPTKIVLNTADIIPSDQPFTSTFTISTSSLSLPGGQAEIYVDSRRALEKPTHDISSSSEPLRTPGATDTIQVKVDSETLSKISKNNDGGYYKFAINGMNYSRPVDPKEVIINQDGTISFKMRTNVLEPLTGFLICYSASGSIEATVLVDIPAYPDDVPDFTILPLTLNAPTPLEITSNLDLDTVELPIGSTALQIAFSENPTTGTYLPLILAFVDPSTKREIIVRVPYGSNTFVPIPPEIAGKGSISCVVVPDNFNGDNGPIYTDPINVEVTAVGNQIVLPIIKN